jgi:hypothetical protein
MSTGFQKSHHTGREFKLTCSVNISSLLDSKDFSSILIINSIFETSAQE